MSGWQDQLTNLILSKIQIGIVRVVLRRLFYQLFQQFQILGVILNVTGIKSECIVEDVTDIVLICY